ncbi:MAG: MgtC/SapB family protein [Chloroflexota bacterium]
MSPELEMVLRLLVAMALGSVIGFERFRAGKPAGLKTNILISAGSALFTIISVFGFGGDPARVAAGVVTGIGFLGAGAIIRRGGDVGGLTTAASVWAVAGIGMAAGAGLYLIATVATGLIVASLIILRVVEEKIAPRHKETKPGERD